MEIEDYVEENYEIKQILKQFIDDSPCDFDHHGGCQSHGFLGCKWSCPMEKAKVILKNGR